MMRAASDALWPVAIWAIDMIISLSSLLASFVEDGFPRKVLPRNSAELAEVGVVGEAG